jgi:enoyl-CoA hydratase
MSNENVLTENRDGVLWLTVNRPEKLNALNRATLGLIPGYAGTQRLPRLVGRGRALEILLSGRNVSAEEAGRIGLANMVCEPADLAETVDALLRKILANGPLAVGHCIEAVNHGLDLPFDDACLLEATLFGVGAASEEMREGTSAFLEKRKAKFRS